MGWHWFPEGPDGVVAQLRRATLEETDDSGTQQILKKLRGLASERPEDVYRSAAARLFVARAGRLGGIVCFAWRPLRSAHRR
jgi:hypothetical protein